MPAPDFQQSTVWQMSVHECAHAETGDSGTLALAGGAVLPRQLCAALSSLERGQRPLQAIDVLAACVRLRVSALILLRQRGMVWPLTLFPQHQLHHLPCAAVARLSEGGRELEVISVEPPGLRAPLGQGTSVSDGSGYGPIQPLLWAMAMHAPCSGLFAEISGRAAYRITADTCDDGLVGGAVKSSLKRLRKDVAALHDIAAWPGMGTDRATRLLNGAYLQGGLRVLRTHPSARDAAPLGSRHSWLTRRP